MRQVLARSVQRPHDFFYIFSNESYAGVPLEFRVGSEVQ